MHIKSLANSNNEQRDVVIITVPWVDSKMPLMAPAALKAVVEENDMTCLGVDTNHDIYDITLAHPLKDGLIKYYFDAIADDDTMEVVYDMIISIVTGILSYSPKVVGLSLFSFSSKHMAKWISYYIRKLDPSVKIILGGAGCLDTFVGPSSYIDDLLNMNLIDYHIRGDGEKTLIELLNGNDSYDGINSRTWKNLTNEELRVIPYPNYDDYDYSSYKLQYINLMGSRGCVRQCTFCDYIVNWKKFTWRTGDDIFNEMMFQKGKYGINDFKFQDSLTNGNQKEFFKLLELMSEYNDTNPHDAIRWSGYYIIRNTSNKSEREWDLLHRSGAYRLIPGVESLNQDIRYAIGKKFTDDAIEYVLEKAYNYNIHLIIMNIVGYVTEEEHHIDYIKSWLDSHTKHKDNITLQWGGGLGIFPETHLYDNKVELGIEMIGEQPFEWKSTVINNTPVIRANRVNDLVSYSEKLGYTCHKLQDNSIFSREDFG